MWGGIVKGGVGRGKETVRENFRNMLEGCVGDRTLRSVGEVGEEDGVGNGDGVGRFKTFGKSDSELAEGDGYRRYGRVGSKRFHCTSTGLQCVIQMMFYVLSYVTMCISYSNCHVLWRKFCHRGGGCQKRKDEM